MRKTPVALATITVLAFSMTACSNDSSNNGNSGTGATSGQAGDGAHDSSASSQLYEVVAATAPADAKTGDSATLRFGDTFRWDDGFAVYVGEPQTFDPSPDAFVQYPDETPLTFDMIFYNGSSESWDSRNLVAAGYGGGMDCHGILDETQGIGGLTDLPTVPAGMALKLKMGITTSDPSHLKFMAAATSSETRTWSNY